MNLDPQTSTFIGAGIVLVGLFLFAKKIFKLALLLLIVAGAAYWWFYIRQ